MTTMCCDVKYLPKPGRKAPVMKMEDFQKVVFKRLLPLLEEEGIDEQTLSFDSFVDYSTRFDFDDDDNCSNEIWAALHNSVYSDLKVLFDAENISAEADEFENESEKSEALYGWQMFNGVPAFGMAAGGDWEHPVYFIVYFDGKKLRGYIPTCGNSYNPLTKTAFGSEQENNPSIIDDDGVFIPSAAKKLAEMFTSPLQSMSLGNIMQSIDFDWQWLRKDIETRIVAVK